MKCRDPSGENPKSRSQFTESAIRVGQHSDVEMLVRQEGKKRLVAIIEVTQAVFV